MGRVGILLAIALMAPLVHAQGYNNGGYGGKTGPSGGGGGGSVTGGSCSSNQYATSINSSGVPTCAQPSANQVTGLAASATTDTTNAANIASGTLNGSRLPTITSANVNSSIAKTANNLSDIASAQVAASNLGLQYYADNCGLPNNGTSDDAAGLRTCMAAMPAGATMNLDGAKPYFFASHSTSDPWMGSQPCETYVHSGQTLKLNGATITQSSAEVGVSGPNFMICAGSMNFNNPGASGGSPTFDNIANTVPNQTFVTLATPSHASNYSTGDDIYIDCGSNAGNADVFVGWNQVSDTNSSTGVINLKYPMLKAYNYTATGCGSGATSARIYDETTCGGNSSYCTSPYSANLGPLAHDVYIEGPGTLIQQTNANPASGIIDLQGTVRFGIDYITAYSSWNSQFIFSNNNHLGTVSHDVFYGWGCGGDTNVNAGEFTSSIDSVDHNKVTLSGDPGVGCGATSGTNTNHEIAFGDSEGDESIKYDYDTAVVKVGLSTNAPNLLSCWFSGGIWSETIDHMECQIDNGTDQGGTQTAQQIGILDTIGATGSGSLVTQGPISVTNSHVSAGSGIAIEPQVQDDLVASNTLDCTNSGSCLSIPYWPGHATSNTINLSACSGSGVGIALGTSQSSTLVDNHIHDVSGTCSSGIKFASGSSTATLVMNDNQIDSSFSSLTNYSSGSFPNASVTSNPGITDYNGSGTGTPGTIQRTGSAFNAIGACQPMVLNGSGSVTTPSSAPAIGVVGFNLNAIPQNTIGQTGTITTIGSTCGKCDGTCTAGDLIELSPTSATEIHDIGTACSGAAFGAQVVGYLNASGTSGSSVSITLEPGLCPTASVPAANVTGLAPSATTDTTNASNITFGTVAQQRLAPAVSAPLNSYYATNGQSMPTFGGLESNGSAQVTELTAPTGVSCTCAGGTGTTYTYAVSSVDYPLNGSAGGYQPPGVVIQGPGGESAKSGSVTCSGPSSLSYPSSYCTVNWNKWSDVGGYKVWGRTSSTNSLTDITKNYGSGGITGPPFVDFGWYTPTSSSQYMTGLFKAECGLGTGDWSWSSWPSSNCGDVYFKEVGSTKESIVVGTTNNQVSTDSNGYLHLIALNGLELQGGATDSNGVIKSGYWPRPPMTAPIVSSFATGTSAPLFISPFTDALYLEKITAAVNTYTCGTAPTFNVYDCGTSNSSCSSDGSVSPTAAGTATGTISTNAISAGHYVEIAASAGSCSSFIGSVTVEYAGN